MTLKAARKYRVAAEDRAGQWGARIAADAEDTGELTFSPAEAEVRTTDIISKAVLNFLMVIPVSLVQIVVIRPV